MNLNPADRTTANRGEAPRPAALAAMARPAEGGKDVRVSAVARWTQSSDVPVTPVAA
jgi:hypothetical protein